MLRTVILAAGRGRRLAEGSADKPKILLEIGGKTLLQRHLELLTDAGCTDITLVVGYRRESIAAELARLGRAHTVRLIDNTDWQYGSVVSLDCAGAILRGEGAVGKASILLMDGDVLYDHRLLARLLESAQSNVLLLDREIEPGDEPVKICVAGASRIVDFAKLPDTEGDWHGESVGFFRLSPEMGIQLAAAVQEVVEAGGRSIEIEYEEPLRSLIRAGSDFGFEDVTGLPWTEIDFMEDVHKARAMLPSLAS